MDSKAAASGTIIGRSYLIFLTSFPFIVTLRRPRVGPCSDRLRGICGYAKLHEHTLPSAHEMTNGRSGGAAGHATEPMFEIHGSNELDKGYIIPPDPPEGRQIRGAADNSQAGADHSVG